MMRNDHQAVQHVPLRRARRGSVVVIVIWAIAIGALIAASVQLFGYRQAGLGADAVQRLQARWAARAGLERTIAVMADHTMEPYPDDAYAMVREMGYVAAGRVGQGTWDIRHWRDGAHRSGPMDEHAKLNLALSNQMQLMLLDDMTLDTADAIADWQDEDSDLNAFGVERDYYLSLDRPFEPRNGRMRSLLELELVAGVWPYHVRGEDWNLNGRLDPNENDGDRTFPRDDPNDVMEPGWSEYLTVYSRAGGATQSGEPRLQLKRAEVEELMDRLDVSEAQALALKEFGRNEESRLEQLYITPLGESDSAPGQSDDGEGEGEGENGGNANGRGGRGGNSGGSDRSEQDRAVEPLTYDQLRTILAECSIKHPEEWQPGKINLNTVPEIWLRDLLIGEETLAEEILYMRANRPEGIVSMLDLTEIPDLSSDRWLQLTEQFGTTSNIYTVTSRGRSDGTGAEVEIIAVVDRSTVPIRILEYREQ